MPTIRISKIKPRRGTDDQRKHMVFDQGEILSTTDTKRLYVGTGSLSGGVVIGSKNHQPLPNIAALTTLTSEIGDIVNINNGFFQLTAADYTNITSWANYTVKIDPIPFSYDPHQRISLNTDSISASYLNSNTVSGGLIISDGILQTIYQPKSLSLSGNKLSLNASGIDEREISSTSFGDGISGGSGNKIQLAVDPTQFKLTSGVLQLSSLPESWIGGGLVYNTNTPLLSTVITSVDGASLQKTNSGVVSIKNDAVSGTNQWGQMTVDQFGRVINQVSSIFSALTASSTLSSYNNTNTLSSIFDGSPSQTLSGFVPGLSITKFTALSSNGATLNLSSAGFITFEGPTFTRDGQAIGKFAIPIFTF